MNFGLLGSLDAMSQVSSPSVLHHNVQFHFGSSVHFPKTNDVGVIEHLQDLSFLQGSFLLVIGHIYQVDLLDHPFLAVLLVENEECPTVRSAAQHFDSFVDIGLTFLVAN